MLASPCGIQNVQALHDQSRRQICIGSHTLRHCALEEFALIPLGFAARTVILTAAAAAAAAAHTVMSTAAAATAVAAHTLTPFAEAGSFAHAVRSRPVIIMAVAAAAVRATAARATAAAAPAALMAVATSTKCWAAAMRRFSAARSAHWLCHW